MGIDGVVECGDLRGFLPNGLQFYTMGRTLFDTSLSAEEIESQAVEAEVQGILDGYANLGIAEVSGYLNVRKTPESFGEVIGKLYRGAACEIVDTWLTTEFSQGERHQRRIDKITALEN